MADSFCGAAMFSLKIAGLLAGKDLRVAYRSPLALLTSLFFGLLILVVFNFAFDPGNPATSAAAPGILWVSLLFPAVIQLNRSFQSEREEGTIHGLVLAPVDKGLIFVGKFLANWLLLLLISFVILAAFVFFYNVTLAPRFFWLLLIVLLATLAISSVGTLFASMVSSIASKEVLLPVLLYPIIVPVLIAAVSASREILLSDQLQHIVSWVKLLVGCDVVFTVSAYMVFDYVAGE
jgi:heme exporter protein B